MKRTQEELEAIVKAREAQKAFQVEARKVVNKYIPEERETWPMQLEEAKAYVADNTSPTPMLDAMLSESGEEKEVLVNRIITKNIEFREAVGKALGKKRSV